MSVRAPRAKKPEMVSEVLRTLQVYDLLKEAVDKRLTYGEKRAECIALLAIAERIAARTSEAE